MSEELKFCRDCKHLGPATNCLRPIKLETPSLVTGEPRAWVSHHDCYFEREHRKYQISEFETMPLCGPEGRFFEAKEN